MTATAVLLLRVFLWLLCFAGVVEAARRVLARFAGEGAYALALPIALGALGYLVQPLSRVVDVGTATVVVGVAGWVLVWRLPRPAFADVRPSTADLPAIPIVVLVFWVLITTNLWDRQFHTALVGVLARGVVPVEHPGFPGGPLAYHASFDFLAAGVRATTGLTLDGAIESIQCLSIVATALATRHALAAARGLWVLPLAAGGPLSLLTGAVPLATFGPQVGPFVDAFSAVPPTVSGLFQPAFALGWGFVPTLFCLVQAPSRSARVVLAVSVLFLSDANVVFFATSGFALAVAFGVEWAQTRSRTALGALGMLFLALVIWRASGTFQPRSGLVVGGFFGSDFALGCLVFLPIPLLSLALFIVFFRAAQTATIFLFSLMCVAAAIGLSLTYEHTWDIVKFLHVASVVGTMLFVFQLRTSGLALRGFAFVAASAVAVVWLVRFGPANGGSFRAYRGDPPSQVATDILDYFGPSIPGDQCIFTYALVAMNAGIRTPGEDPKKFAGVLDDASRWEQRRAAWLALRDQPTLEGLRAYGCNYVLVPDPVLRPDPDGRLFGELLPLRRAPLDGAPWTLYRFPDRANAE
jgi:hypothetical protein